MTTHIDDNEKECKFCTRCICKAPGKKRIYQLSHLDSEHNDDRVSKKAEANLTRVEDNDPSDYIPYGTPAVTTREPTVDASDDDEIVYTGAWFTPVEYDEDTESPSPQVNFCPTAFVYEDEDAEDGIEHVAMMFVGEREKDSSEDDDSCPPPGLMRRHDIDSSDDEDSDLDYDAEAIGIDPAPRRMSYS
jgi:hypothetical protein